MHEIKGIEATPMIRVESRSVKKLECPRYYHISRFLVNKHRAKDKATLRGLKKEYQHSVGLTVELDKVLLIIGSLVFIGR
jgi:hypothetical protein